MARGGKKERKTENKQERTRKNKKEQERTRKNKKVKKKKAEESKRKKNKEKRADTRTQIHSWTAMGKSSQEDCDSGGEGVFQASLMEHDEQGGQRSAEKLGMESSKASK